MKKRLKVFVSGFINETFVGTEKEVEIYLTNLKNKQLSCLNSDLLKEYKTFPKAAPLNKFHLQNERLNANDRIDKDSFRAKTKEFGLKIKIQRIEENNEFF